MKNNKSKKSKLIRITRAGPKGFFTSQVPVIKAVDDGAFLTKSPNGKHYVVTDARTGYEVCGGKTQKECLQSYEKIRQKYLRFRKDKKSLRYRQLVQVNRKNKNGEWVPVENTPEFDVIRTVYSEKRMKGAKYVHQNTAVLPVNGKKNVEDFMKKRATDKPGIPTIRKIYAGPNGITKVVNYAKGAYHLRRESTFLVGKDPKGTKMVSKQFIK